MALLQGTTALSSFRYGGYAQIQDDNVLSIAACPASLIKVALDHISALPTGTVIFVHKLSVKMAPATAKGQSGIGTFHSIKKVDQQCQQVLHFRESMCKARECHLRSVLEREKEVAVEEQSTALMSVPRIGSTRQLVLPAEDPASLSLGLNPLHILLAETPDDLLSLKALIILSRVESFLQQRLELPSDRAPRLQAKLVKLRKLRQNIEASLMIDQMLKEKQPTLLSRNSNFPDMVRGLLQTPARPQQSFYSADPQFSLPVRTSGGFGGNFTPVRTPFIEQLPDSDTEMEMAKPKPKRQRAPAKKPPQPLPRSKRGRSRVENAPTGIVLKGDQRAGGRDFFEDWAAAEPPRKVARTFGKTRLTARVLQQHKMKKTGGKN